MSAIRPKPKTADAPTPKRANARDAAFPGREMEFVSKNPNLLQYVRTGMYYARVEVCGKLVRRKLKTDVYSKVLLRLGDFLKEQRSKAPRSDNSPTTFAQARILFEQDLEVRHELQARAKEYRRGFVNSVLTAVLTRRSIFTGDQPFV
jgi:hypothetical protein